MESSQPPIPFDRQGLVALNRLSATLDQYYVATRYPNRLSGGVPFEAFGRTQAEQAIEGAARFAAVARASLGNA